MHFTLCTTNIIFYFLARICRLALSGILFSLLLGSLFAFMGQALQRYEWGAHLGDGLPHLWSFLYFVSWSYASFCWTTFTFILTNHDHTVRVFLFLLKDYTLLLMLYKGVTYESLWALELRALCVVVKKKVLISCTEISY